MYLACSTEVRAILLQDVGERATIDKQRQEAADLVEAKAAAAEEERARQWRVVRCAGLQCDRLSERIQGLNMQMPACPVPLIHSSHHTACWQRAGYVMGAIGPCASCTASNTLSSGLAVLGGSTGSVMTQSMDHGVAVP